MTEIDPSPKDDQSQLGLVSRWLPWNWSTTPHTLQVMVVVAADLYTKVKDVHPVCASALGAAESRARLVSNITVGFADKAAQTVDKRLEALLDDSRKGLTDVEEYSLKQWSKLQELRVITVARIEESSGFQVGLGLADSMLAVMDKLLSNYKALLTNTRRWIRRTRRRGQKSSQSRMFSPCKRIKLVNRLWNLISAGSIPTDGEEKDRKRKIDEMSSDSDTFADPESDRDDSVSNASSTGSNLKTKLDAIPSESESSNEDPDYGPEDADSTDSLEYNSGEEDPLIDNEDLERIQ